MDFRTVIRVEPSEEKVGYGERVLFAGSCFAGSIGMKMSQGKMPVMINPAGTVYNPVSVSAVIELIMNKRDLEEKDLSFNDGEYLSFLHNTDFTSEDPQTLLKVINDRTRVAGEFIAGAKFLFITFGTARVYRRRDNGMIVSNCHRFPSSFFDNELLSPDDITGLWKSMLDSIHKRLPSLKVVFTVSPVRHWKDGAHGNQVSKSVLFLAVEELLSHPAVWGYFPAYELVMDDLRDYRFYDSDMLHLSPVAADYVWDAFTGCFFEEKTMALWKEVMAVTKARQHRLINVSRSGIEAFAKTMLVKIEEIHKKEPLADLSADKDYFSSLI